jgi:hypothetical protein
MPVTEHASANVELAGSHQLAFRVPFSDDPMQQPIAVTAVLGKHAVFMPSAVYAVPNALFHCVFRRGCSVQERRSVEAILGGLGPHGEFDKSKKKWLSHLNS